MGLQRKLSTFLSNCLIWDFYTAGTGERWETI